MKRNRILPLLFLELLSHRYCYSSETNNNQQCYNVGKDETCYFEGSTEPSNWSTAYQICRTKGARLPAIGNADDQYALEKYLKYLKSKSSNVSVIWTSGRREVLNDWTWINGQPISDKSRQNLLASSETYQTHNFIAIQDNNTLVPGDPDFLSPFFCQYYGGQCASKMSFRLDGSCIVYHHYMESWFDARDDCLFRGGDLAVLTDIDKQILTNITQGQLPHFRFWIGLTNIAWFWMTDIEKSLKEEVKYSKWSRYAWRILGDQCIRIDAFNGKWMKSDCNGRVSVICQRKGTSSTAVAKQQVGAGNSGGMAFGVQNSGTVVLMLLFGIILGSVATVVVMLITKRRRPVLFERLEEMDRTQKDSSSSNYIA